MLEVFLESVEHMLSPKDSIYLRGISQINISLCRLYGKMCRVMNDVDLKMAQYLRKIFTQKHESV